MRLPRAIAPMARGRLPSFPLSLFPSFPPSAGARLTLRASPPLLPASLPPTQRTDAHPARAGRAGKKHQACQRLQAKKRGRNCARSCCDRPESCSDGPEGRSADARGRVVRRSGECYSFLGKEFGRGAVPNLREETRSIGRKHRRRSRATRTGLGMSHFDRVSVQSRRRSARSCRVAPRFDIRCVISFFGDRVPPAGSRAGLAGPSIRHAGRRARTLG